MHVTVWKTASLAWQLSVRLEASSVTLSEAELFSVFSPSEVCPEVVESCFLGN